MALQAATHQLHALQHKAFNKLLIVNKVTKFQMFENKTLSMNKIAEKRYRSQM
jgi:hypothetical protein